MKISLVCHVTTKPDWGWRYYIKRDTPFEQKDFEEWVHHIEGEWPEIDPQDVKELLAAQARLLDSEWLGISYETEDSA